MRCCLQSRGAGGLHLGRALLEVQDVVDVFCACAEDIDKPEARGGAFPGGAVLVHALQGLLLVLRELDAARNGRESVAQQEDRSFSNSCAAINKVAVCRFIQHEGIRDGLADGGTGGYVP